MGKLQTKRLFLFLIVLILSVLAAATLWFFLKPAVKPYKPILPVIGAMASQAEIFEDGNIEGMSKLIDTAKTHGVNAVFAATSLGEDFLASLDEICEAAASEKMAVYLMVSPATTLSDTTFFDSIISTVKNYKIAGIILDDITAKNSSSEDILNIISEVIAANPAMPIGISGTGKDFDFNDKLTEFVAAGAEIIAPELTPSDDHFDVAVATKASQVFIDASKLTSEEILSTVSPIAITTTIDGILFNSADITPAENSIISSMLSTQDEYSPLDLTEILSVSSPENGGTVYTDTVQIIGRSAVTAPLYINGEMVNDRAALGSFAYSLPVELGDNEIILKQGDDEIKLTVTRAVKKKYSWNGGSTKTTTTPADGYIKITNPIASALSESTNDSSISATLKEGGVAHYKELAQVWRSGKYVTAYVLDTGDFVLGSNCDEVASPENKILDDFEKTNEGRIYTFTLAGATPACYTRIEDNSLIIDFLNAEFKADLVDEEVFSNQSIEVTEQGSTLTLEFAEDFDFWGYDISYTEDSTVLRVKLAPELSTKIGAPLDGVTIMLDPGHGYDDNGAPGIAGVDSGYTEKDLNLVTAGATATHLRSLGATVTLTREDDSFPTLQERHQLAGNELPDYYISLHHNSIELLKNPSEVSGVEAFYFDSESSEFSESLMKTTAAATQRKERYSNEGYFYVCRQTGMKSVLLELGYMVNPDEFEDCVSLEGVLRAASGVAGGIIAVTPSATE